MDVGAVKEEGRDTAFTTNEDDGDEDFSDKKGDRDENNTDYDFYGSLWGQDNKRQIGQSCTYTSRGGFESRFGIGARLGLRTSRVRDRIRVGKIKTRTKTKVKDRVKGKIRAEAAKER